MTEQVHSDLNLSGMGAASGGLYENVDVQGMGKVHGDIECATCNIEGLATIFGSVKAKTIQVKGKTRVEGNLRGEDVLLEGRVTIAGECDAERFTGKGAIKIDGMLNADEIRLQLYGPSQVREIGAATIRIEKEHGTSLFNRFKMLSVDTIEGDDIYLENTKARFVRGNKVVVGSGCDIAVVEYRTQFEQHKSSHVTHQKQV